MKWNLILCVKEVALLQSESNRQFVVAFGYDPKATEGQQWSHGRYFMYNNDREKLIALQSATSLLRSRTEEDYISRDRLVELATRFEFACLDKDDFAEIWYDMDDYERWFFRFDDDTDDESVFKFEEE